MKKKKVRALEQLARLHGVQLTYNDIRGQRVWATPESLLAVLRALGEPVAEIGEAREALARRRLALWHTPLPLSRVAWDGLLPPIPLRLAENHAAGHYKIELLREDGAVEHIEGELADLPTRGARKVEGITFVVKLLTLPDRLAHGYHRLIIDLPGGHGEMAIISAPPRAWSESDGQPREWGAFVPLYALRTERDWGVGGLGDFEALADWINGLGGGVVASLPMLAGFLGDNPHEPSPYAPASRLFWNELYLDIERIPELDRAPHLRERIASEGFQQRLAELRTAEQVPYREAMALKRELLEELAEFFFNDPGARAGDYLRFLERQPLVEDYASFRAVGDRLGRSWHIWPGPLRAGMLRAGDWRERDRRYHLYVQFLMDEQMAALGRRLEARGHGLYLDMPLGVGSDSYDVWRERAVFAMGASGGSPPDGFFALGQDWGFPPLHPARLREQGFRYEIESVRQLMRGAGMIRIDHVMGLHRLFWVPHGLKPTEGVYVRYPTEERFAIICLESHRTRTAVVGEDLGTVPQTVRERMGRHGLGRMYVMQFTFNPDPHGAARAPDPGMIASLNTHDTPTFRAFWDGLDLGIRKELGLLDEGQLEYEGVERSRLKWAMTHWFVERGLMAHGEEGDPACVLAACLRFLASSEAALALVTLEDLWLEPLPQNVPGTGPERPNWRRRAQWTLESIQTHTAINELLREINTRRRRE